MRKTTVKSTVIGFALLFFVIASVRASDAAVHVVWMDNTPGNYEIYFKTSADNGATWSANKRLTNNIGTSYGPSIAVNGSNIHVVWNDYTPGNSEIYYKTSADGGAAWSANKRLTFNSGASYAPSIAVNGSNIHVVWVDDTPGNYEIYFKTSADNGATWSANKRLTNNTGWSYAPSIAVNGSNIHVAWTDYTPGNSEIYYKTSADNGATWSANKRLTFNTGWSYVPSIAVNGSNIHVTWVDSTPGNWEIYYRTSADNGATWSAKKRLTFNTGMSYNPSIAVNGSNIHVAWMDDTPGNWDIYYSKSADNGATWSANKRLTNNTGDSQYPSIAVNGSNIHVTWQDNTPGNWDIYHKTSADNGATWSANKRLTFNSGASQYPSIAVAP